MSASTPNRARPFGLRIVSSDGKQLIWFAGLSAMALNLALRLHAATHRLGHSTNIGLRVPFTMVDADGLRLSWIRETPYQAKHSHYGATWRLRTEWQTFEAFDCKSRPLRIQSVLRSIDLKGQLARRQSWPPEHGDRGLGPVPNIQLGFVQPAVSGIYRQPWMIFCVPHHEAERRRLRHSTSGPQYVIYFPEADNVVSELMVAGYQKFLENDFMGLSNSTVQVKNAMNQYGQTGLQLDGHSRGAMTIGNGLESKAQDPAASGSLSATTIHFFGPAYNAQHADDLLSTLQDRPNLPGAQQSEVILQFQNHAADPVGGLIGGHPSTGGTIPEGSSTPIEAIRAGTGQTTTVHNCYGLGPTQCQQFWQDFPNQQPLLMPVQRGSIQQ